MDKSHHETIARAAKVARLAMTARQAHDGAGFSASDLEAFTPEQWTLLAEAAGTRPPSETTQQMVVDVARGWSEVEADDPFVGL